MALSARTAVLTALAALFTLGAERPVSPPLISLAQAGDRRAPDFAPIRAGSEVEVRGVASQGPSAIANYDLLPIQDATAYGLMLATTSAAFQKVRAGDEVRAVGVIGMEAGLVVLRVKHAEVVGHVAPPAPLPLQLKETLDLRYEGVLIATEGEVSEVGENSAGEFLMLNGRKGLKVFLPGDLATLQRFRPGDRIRAAGVGIQYTNKAPYNRNFELLISAPESVTLISSAWLISPSLAVSALLIIFLASAVLFVRIRRMNRLREAVRALTDLGEHSIGSQSPGEIVARLASVLPAVLHITGVRLLLYRKETETLEKVPTPDDPEPHIISVQDADDSSGGPGICCHNRALLSVPDTRSSSARRLLGEQTARSLIFVPMLAQEELFGVLELRHNTRVRNLTRDESDALQHLANQVATALKLIAQLKVQDELSRSEKLATAGLLISSVVSDLRSPVDAITRVAENLSNRPLPRETADEVSGILLEARRAAQIVSRLAGFAWQRTETRPVDLNRLLETEVAARENEWRQLGIERRISLSLEPVSVIAAEAQLQQVLTSLLRRTETALAESPQKWLSVTSHLLARRAIIEITAPVSSEGPAAPADALGLEICRGIIHSFGGELRTGAGGSSQRFEIDLPIAQQETSLQNALPSFDHKGKTFSILVVEPEASEQRLLLMLLGERGHRVVPVSTAEEAIDLTQRMTFDIVFSAMRLSGLNWLELFEKVRPHIGAFVLLTEGFDPPLAAKLGDVLRRPVNASELDRVLAGVFARLHEATSRSSSRVAQA